jgi:hypothetical protein
MHFLRSITKQPNLELKTWPKQLLGYLPLDIALPDQPNLKSANTQKLALMVLHF